MRLRASIAAVIAVAAMGAGLVQATPAHAATFICSWTPLEDDSVVFGGHEGALTAGPLVEVGAATVEVICQGRLNGAPVSEHSRLTPGSAGFYDDIHYWYVDAGDVVEYCTYTVANLSGIRKFRGCEHAFTA